MRQDGWSSWAALVCMVGWPWAAMSQTATWTGGSATSDAWTDGANWQSGAPAAGDALEFDGATRLTPNNDYAAGTQFDGIAFLATAGAFVISGSAIDLGGDIGSAAAGTQTINLGITLLGNTAVHISANDASSRITFGGNLGGSYGLTLSGTEPYGYNRVTLSGVNGYTGVTTVGAAGNRVTGWVTDPGALPGDVVVVNGSSLRLRPAGAAKTFANNIGIDGDGVDSLGRATWVPRQNAGALILNNDADVAGTVTLLGNSRISANCDDTGTTGMAGKVSGKITGNYALQFGFVQERPGTVTITNPENDWTGDTVETGGGSTGSSGRVFTLRLGADNVIPSGPGRGKFTINTNNSRVESLGNDQSLNGFYGNNADARYTGGGTLTVGNADADGNYPGVLTVATLVKTGAGTQLLRGTTSGNLAANAGTLAFSGTYTAGNVTVADGAVFSLTGGVMRSSGTVAVDAGGTFEIDGGTLRYTSSTPFSGEAIFTSGILEGTNWLGGLSGLAIGAERTISPGTNVAGVAVTASQTWAPGGTYAFDLGAATGTAGVEWDLLTVTGALDLSTLSSENRFVIRPVSPAPGEGEPGMLDGVPLAQWTLVEFGSLSGAFNPGLFEVDTTQFGHGLGDGAFSVVQDGTTLALKFSTAPSGTLLLVE